MILASLYIFNTCVTSEVKIFCSTNNATRHANFGDDFVETDRRFDKKG